MKCPFCGKRKARTVNWRTDVAVQECLNCNKIWLEEHYHLYFNIYKEQCLSTRIKKKIKFLFGYLVKTIKFLWRIL